MLILSASSGSQINSPTNIALTIDSDSTDQAILHLEGPANPAANAKMFTIDKGATRLFDVDEDGDVVALASVTTPTFVFDAAASIANAGAYLRCGGDFDIEALGEANYFFRLDTGGDHIIQGQNIQVLQRGDLSSGNLLGVDQSGIAYELTGAGHQAVFYIGGEFAQSGAGAASGLWIDPEYTSNGDGSSGFGNNALTITTNATTLLLKVDQDGSVGIGPDTSPDALLHVQGTMEVDDFCAELSMAHSNDQSFTASTAAAITNWTANRVDASYSSTHSNITVTSAGWYLVTIEGSFETDSASQGQMRVRTNEVVATGAAGSTHYIGWERTQGSVTSDGVTMSSMMIELAASTRVSAWLEFTANENLTWDTARLRVERK
jgi:hypothetical protein